MVVLQRHEPVHTQCRQADVHVILGQLFRDDLRVASRIIRTVRVGAAAVVEVELVTLPDRFAGPHLRIEFFPTAPRPVRDECVLATNPLPVLAVTAHGQVWLKRVPAGFLPHDRHETQVQPLVTQSLHVVEIFPLTLVGLEDHLDWGPRLEVLAEGNGSAELIVDRPCKEHPPPLVDVVHGAAGIAHPGCDRLRRRNPPHSVS